jgi:hemerythrin
MNEFKEEFNNGKAGISIQLMNFLANWLRGHILGSDMGYTDFFVEKGIQ